MDPDRPSITIAPNYACRIWEPTDIPEIVRWHEARGILPPVLDLMPPLGAVAGPLFGGHILPQACAFVHRTKDGTGVAFLDWLAVAPEASPTSAMRSVDTVIQFLQHIAAREGFGHLIALMRDERLARLAEKRHGFQTTNKGVLSQWKAIP